MRQVAASVAVGSVLAMVGALVVPPTRYSEPEFTWLIGLFGVVYVLVGTVLAQRRGDNPLGWLLLAIGAGSGIVMLLGSYAGYALVVRPDLPGGAAAAWVTAWIFWPMAACLVLVVALFPEGSLEGRTRRWAARIGVAAAGLLTVGTMATPGPLDGFGGVTNPFGLPALATPLAWVTRVSTLALVLGFLAALASTFLRLRRATDVERRQLSWFAYATTLMVLAQLINVPLLGLDDSFFGLLAVVLAIVAFPAAIAVAVLRHRLYDIDRIISRTLVYGTLTAALLATYLAAVLVLQVVLDPFTGSSDLAVAGSTLAVAALFQPFRRRIQSVVDRRFYRRRYDAARSLESFVARLRQEVDLDAVTADLHDVVRDTVNPSHLSVWLRRPS